MDTSHFFNVRNNRTTPLGSENPGYSAPVQATPRAQFESLGFAVDEEDGPVHGNRTSATQPTRAPFHADSETLTPVTIKQVRDGITLGAEPVRINNTVTKHITVVARVLRVDTGPTRISLLLDDCTAIIGAVYLTSPDEDMLPNEYALRRRRIAQGLWIRIIGVLCLMDGETKISVIRMRPVDDANELIFHRLDAIKTFLQQTRSENRSIYAMRA